MNVLGVIAEYNPFHNGHKYHLRQAIEKSGAEAVIAVISSNLVQRGEFALLEKHIRAQMAILNGISLVIELPSIFSSASAEYFAFGGVSALNSTGLVTHIGFGCEDPEISKMNEAANILANESDEFILTLRQFMSTGLSYAKARILACEKFLDFPVDFLVKSNNILAVEYLKALKRLKSNIIPCPVKRIGSDYRELELTDKNPSSSALRKFIYENPPEDLFEIKKYMPYLVFDILNDHITFKDFPDRNKFDVHVLTLLRTLPIEDIRNLPYVCEGLEHRLIKAARECVDLGGFYKMCNSSRYPDSRISRIIACLLAGVTKDILNEAKINGVPYLKVLAFSEKGEDLLRQMKKTAFLPIITKPSDLKKLTGFASLSADIENRVTDIFNLSLFDPKPAGSEYKTTPYCFLS